MRALAFVWRRWWLRYPLMLGGLGFGLYLTVWLMIAQRAYARLAQEPVASDVVLVLAECLHLKMVIWQAISGCRFLHVFQ